MEQPGVLEWCNSTRFAMINDPGRQLFQDQINTHGFLFLNDYLDNILAGPRRDPLIELVKTPGRKKTTGKRPVAATSGLKNVTVSLEDENDAGSKENLVPVNSFHRALLQAKEKTPSPKVPSHESHTRETPVQIIEQPLPPQESRPHDPAHNPAQKEVFESHVDEAPDFSKALDPIVQVDPLPNATPIRIPSPPPPVVCDDEFVVQPPEEKPQFLTVAATEPNDLSMIAEDDETDRSRASLPCTEVHAPTPEIREETAAGDSLADAAATVAASLPSADTSHTIPLSPAQPAQLPDAVPSPVAFRSPSPPSPHGSPLPATLSDTRSPAEYHTASLPEIPPRHSRDASSDMTEPLPAVTEEASNVEMTDVAAQAPHISPKGLTHKPSVPSFPSLPSLPLPFRKSIRVPSDPAAAPGPLGAATPGGALGGKRTSWLMRAREVKALEITVKKPNPAPSLGAGMQSGNKRKSGDMFGVSGATGLEEEERRHKAAKTIEGDVAPMRPRTPESTQPKAEHDAEQPSTQPQEGQEGLLVQLKRTVDDLGSRFGKSMGKSLGGTAAANALAEARAAAEARLVERQHKEEEATMALGPPAARSSTEHSPVFHSSHSRLSVSELVVTSPENRGKGKEVSDPAPESFPSAHDTHLGDKSANIVSTSPAPPVFHMAPAPVFNKPPPVFVPPAPAPTSEPSTFKIPVTTAFSKPASMALGLAPRLPSPKQTAPVPLSAQSTLESLRSDRLFDSQGSQDDVPAWMPATQDTEYTSGFGSQSQCSPIHGGTADLDDDDSWPLAERVGAWFGLNAKEDTGTTWSSQPTPSQRIDPEAMPQDVDAGFIAQDETGLIQGDANASYTNNDREFHQPIPGSFRMDLDDEEEDNDDRAAAFNQSVLGEMEIDPSKSTVSLVEPRSQSQMSQMSQMSTASSASSQSQSQGGFLGHASKLMNSVLGTSKKAKPEVKSLQLAAIAAKKQQEEKEKKASMLKNMEARRQAHLQRKAEEEKAKALEEERKLKEERDRLKKEREEYTGKQPLPMKSVGAKKEEEKKRKIVGELDKKPELKKPTLKQPVLNSSTSSKLLSKTPVTKPSQSALASSATYNAASSSKLTESNVAKLQGKGKLPAKNIPAEDDVSQPSLLLQSQMAARAKAQMQAANPAPPLIPSESIELPDINSEYSDSDDEDRPRTFDPPSWAQDTMLQQALQVQSTINPDDIFGAVRPLKMEEVFRNRTGRFRARTSSANWTGTDRLTVEEEREYARRMGFR
ncbi:hypothetical protein C8R45DRAFT_952785 [Mycena sanguinolenta]|nr:hypothetical protein C8R45DRAFT_952785 [Mycena sanguinolenta]